MRKSCENMAITWLRGGHPSFVVLLILENSKKMGNFGMVCAIVERSGNCQQIRHKNGLNFERLCKRPKSESDYRCERGQKRAKKEALPHQSQRRDCSMRKEASQQQELAEEVCFAHNFLIRYWNGVK